MNKPLKVDDIVYGRHYSGIFKYIVVRTTKTMVVLNSGTRLDIISLYKKGGSGVWSHWHYYRETSELKAEYLKYINLAFINSFEFEKLSDKDIHTVRDLLQSFKKTK